MLSDTHSSIKHNNPTSPIIADTEFDELMLRMESDTDEPTDETADTHENTPVSDPVMFTTEEPVTQKAVTCQWEGGTTRITTEHRSVAAAFAFNGVDKYQEFSWKEYGGEFAARAARDLWVSEMESIYKPFQNQWRYTNDPTMIEMKLDGVFTQKADCVVRFHVELKDKVLSNGQIWIAKKRCSSGPHHAFCEQIIQPSDPTVHGKEMYMENYLFPFVEDIEFRDENPLHLNRSNILHRPRMHAAESIVTAKKRRRCNLVNTGVSGVHGIHKLSDKKHIGKGHWAVVYKVDKKSKRICIPFGTMYEGEYFTESMAYERALVVRTKVPYESITAKTEKLIANGDFSVLSSNKRKRPTTKPNHTSKYPPLQLSSVESSDPFVVSIQSS
jgi:hypothetical protein